MRVISAPAWKAPDSLSSPASIPSSRSCSATPRSPAAWPTQLLQRGIYVIGFSFPVVPKGQARIRTQMSAALTREQLDRAIAAFTAVGRELGVINRPDMKALVKKEAAPGIWLDDVPEPKVGPNDVLIEIDKTAICGTDMHIYNGMRGRRKPSRCPWPWAMSIVAASSISARRSAD